MEPSLLKPELFLANSLMFGEVAAVFHFNRCARALHWMLLEIFWVVAANYFDDDPLLEPDHVLRIRSRLSSWYATSWDGS